MGRGITSPRFKDDFAERLRAARISAGYRTQKEFAERSGIPLENYKKYESGRTPIPHRLMGLVCELIDKDANYLYGIEPRVPIAARKAG